VYAQPSPVKRPKPEKVYDKEIIEEIIFHHPPYLVSSPQKLFKSQDQAKAELSEDEEDDDEQMYKEDPNSKNAFVNSSNNLNKNEQNRDIISSNLMSGVNDSGEEIIGFNLPPHLL
jgi:site-specific DNA-adenine methylase